MFDMPLHQTQRFPFDRIGVTALICAVLFAAVATGLSLMLS